MKTSMVDTCHYTLIKEIESSTPRVNPKVNYGLWVIMMCQGWLTSVINLPNKCTTLVKDAHSRGHCSFVQAGVYGNRLYLTLNFVMHLKCSLQMPV